MFLLDFAEGQNRSPGVDIFAELADIDRKIWFIVFHYIKRLGLIQLLQKSNHLPF
jgi:hypothetical protein